MCIDIAEILLVGTVVAHLASLAVGVALYGVEELGASGNVENLVYLLQCGIADLSQGSCTLLAVRVGELSENLLVVIDNPLPYNTLLGVHIGAYGFGCQTISRTQDIVAYGAFDGQLLAALLTLYKETQLLRQRTQSLNYIAGGVASRAARAARHTLAAIPYSVAFEQSLDGLIIASLYD